MQTYYVTLNLAEMETIILALRTQADRHAAAGLKPNATRLHRLADTLTHAKREQAPLAEQPVRREDDGDILFAV